MSYPGGKVKSIALGRFSILEPRKRDFVRFKKKLIFSCSFGNLTGFDTLRHKALCSEIISFVGVEN